MRTEEFIDYHLKNLYAEKEPRVIWLVEDLFKLSAITMIIRAAK